MASKKKIKKFVSSGEEMYYKSLMTTSGNFDVFLTSDE